MYEVMGFSIMMSYFWILKAVAICILCYVFYDIIKSKKISKVKAIFYGIIVITILVAGNSVRLVPNTAVVNAKIDKVIEAQKVLPEKVIDKSFEEATKQLKGISKEELK